RTAKNNSFRERYELPPDWKGELYRFLHRRTHAAHRSSYAATAARRGRMRRLKHCPEQQQQFGWEQSAPANQPQYVDERHLGHEQLLRSGDDDNHHEHEGNLDLEHLLPRPLRRPDVRPPM